VGEALPEPGPEQIAASVGRDAKGVAAYAAVLGIVTLIAGGLNIIGIVIVSAYSRRVGLGVMIQMLLAGIAAIVLSVGYFTVSSGFRKVGSHPKCQDATVAEAISSLRTFFSLLVALVLVVLLAGCVLGILMLLPPSENK
jgi:hypothetical protein